MKKNETEESRPAELAGHTSIITKETTFRSKPLVNMTDNMVRVELITSRNNWRRIKRAIKAVVS